MSKKRQRLPRDAILANKESHDEFAARNALAAEARRVKFLLARLHLPSKKKWDMLRVAKERTGTGRLTLDLFNEMCPTFPLLLGYAPPTKVDRLHLDNKSTLPALFRRFQDAPFVKAYVDFYEEATRRADGRAIGMLFARKGIVQGLIMHDSTSLFDLWNPGFKGVYMGGTRAAPAFLYLQSFASLVEAIHNRGHGWKAEFTF